MKRMVTALVASIFAVSGHVNAQGVDPALFGALPAIQDAEISPDGKTAAVIQNAGDRSIVVFLELNNSEAAPKGVEIGR